MSRIIALGDIHGYYYTMLDLFKKLDIDFGKDKIIFLGDYIDRGNFPVRTLKYIKELQESYPDNVVCLKGNHEDMCIQYFFEGNECWSWNGFRTTYRQLIEMPKEERKELLEWTKNLPLRYETDEYRFCHSGYWAEGLDDYGYERVLWDRQFLQYNTPDKDDRPIIFGHTPHKMPYWYNFGMCIDTGVCFDGMLTAAVIENDGVTAVSVDVNEEDGVI